MTLEKIVQEVLKQGQAEANKIHKDAGKQALVILDQATKEVARLNDDAKHEASAEAHKISRKIDSAAELESKKQILLTKAEMLDHVKTEVLRRMRDQPVVDRERHMKRLLARARNIIPEGTVRARKEDHDILKNNLGGYRMGEPVAITGGLIVESLDRTRVLDLSFETLFEEVWRKNIAQTSHEMFGEVRV